MHKHYHLVGIGGIGMSGIAKLLLQRGMKVSGSDLKEGRVTQELRRLGAAVFLGHLSDNVDGADLVIYSSAIKDDNPELRQARALGIPVLRRAEALARLMKNKTVITVTGSHGKTTTASLVSYLLLRAGFSPTVAVGGILKNIDNNAYIGEGEFFVAEADESDGSFLYYQPKYSIITNIDYEHLDYYRTFDNALHSFKEFLDKTIDSGVAFCCGDDDNLKDLLRGYKGRYVSFGLKEGAGIYPLNIKIDGLSSEFECFYKNRLLGKFRLNLGGKHNISNALAVIAVGLELGISLETIKKALAGYQGVGRRLEIKFRAKDYILIDDYAHHPTEIRATLAAVKEIKKERILAVFQPHRYSRTKLLLDEFSRSFDLADLLIITDIYPANESPIAGVCARMICDRIKERAPDKEVIFLPKDQIISYILGVLRPGDLVITLGAGDIIKNCDELAEILKGEN